MLNRAWKDNGFQFGVVLLFCSAIAAASALVAPTSESDLIPISGQIEKIRRTTGRSFGSSKLIIYVRTNTGLIQVNAKPWVDRDETLAPGQTIRGLISYDDMFGRDIAFAYELTRGSEVLLAYESKASADEALRSGLAYLSPVLAIVGLILCAVRFRKVDREPRDREIVPPPAFP